MFKILEFFRLVSMGFSFKKAITHNHVKFRDWEWFALMLVLFIIFVELYKHQQVVEKNILLNKEMLIQKSLSEVNKLNGVIKTHKSKIATLENTFISCLNHKGVIVNGRSMNCTIKDYY